VLKHELLRQGLRRQPANWIGLMPWQRGGGGTEPPQRSGIAKPICGYSRKPVKPPQQKIKHINLIFFFALWKKHSKKN